MRAASIRPRPNPYAQVALTYLRRPGAPVTAVIYAGVFVIAILIGTQFLWLVVVFGASMHWVYHTKEQFADPRAHLMPNFRRVHAAVASAVAFVVTVLLPTALAWRAGLHSVGLVAASLAIFGGFVWLDLIQSKWLSFSLYVLLLAFIFGRVDFRFEPFLSGQMEAQAILALVVGAAATVLGAARLFRLNEEIRGYRRPVRRDPDETGPTPASDNADQEWLPRGLKNWLTDRHMAGLVRHARRASTSGWSRVCRWQIGTVTGSSVLPLALATFLCVLVLNWSRHALAPTDRWSLLIMVVAPGVIWLSQWSRRYTTLARCLLLPVRRSAFVRQVGTAAALSLLEIWVAITAGAIFGSSICAGQPPRPVVIANVLATSAAAQIWLFGVWVWLVRFPGCAGAALFVTLLATMPLSVLCIDPSLYSWQFTVWLIAALFAAFGAFLTWSAYYRWLAADIDSDFLEAHDVGQRQFPSPVAARP